MLFIDSIEKLPLVCMIIEVIFFISAKSRFIFFDNFLCGVVVVSVISQPYSINKLTKMEACITETILFHLKLFSFKTFSLIQKLFMYISY